VLGPGDSIAPMRFAKYHALGNDYLVLPAEAAAWSPARVARCCHRHLGMGSDGILAGPSTPPDGAFGLRIFNPDGSEAEFSGNGLRIFARHLLDLGLVQAEQTFRLRTLAGDTVARVAAGGRAVTLELAPPSFDSTRIPVAGPAREVLREPLELPAAEGEPGVRLEITAVSVGNPHCVLLDPDPDAARARRLGPRIERHPQFPRRTNVQWLAVRSRRQLSIEIWERGAGYTLASGSSACAVAAVAWRLGLADPQVEVTMPGGSVLVSQLENGGIALTGPVVRVGEGTLDAEAWADL
jgi:diaminopimelate epimerase